MKRICFAALMLISLVLTAMKTEAATVYTDTFDPTDNVLLTAAASNCVEGSCKKTWEFNILNDGYPINTPISSAFIEVFVYDDTDPKATTPENYKITLDSNLLSGNYSGNTNYNFDLGTLSLLSVLESDGKIVVVLSAQVGDFYFDKAVLTATVVPVPAAVWLFGSALFGLIGFARRKAQ